MNLEQYTRKNDALIQRKIDRGIWLPSMDTGHIYSTDKHANLNETINNAGYSLVGNKDILVSRVIWIAAHGIPEPNMEIDHINGDKQDNRLINLQLVTRSENCLKATGVLTFDDAQAIRAAHQNGETKSSLARKYHVSWKTINRIIDGQTYKSRPPHEQSAMRAYREIITLDEKAIDKICAEHQRGASYRQIANRWDLAPATVKTIIRGGGAQ